MKGGFSCRGSGGSGPGRRARSHSMAPTSEPTTLPSRSMSSVVGIALAPNACAVALSASSVERQVADVALLEEPAHRDAAVIVDRNRQHGEAIVAMQRLQAIERRHLGPAWSAPGRPDVQQDDAAAEIGKREVLSGGGPEFRRRRRLRLGRRGEAGRAAVAAAFEAREQEEAGGGAGTSARPIHGSMSAGRRCPRCPATMR